MRPDLHSLPGLGRIWSDVNATQQYFPLLHTAFWLEYQLWRERPTGYHLVAIALHCLAAILFWQVLRRLHVPGCRLAAAIFALHPVHVESVAWIAELKNTLSGVLYLGAMLAYLAFDRARAMRWYALALALFVLALLSKTTTATLPAALLVIFWWQRGRLTWKGDVLPLLPLFLAGAGEGLFTAWVELHVLGAEGAAFAFPALERCLLAGRAAWFYLGKLAWPTGLNFMYPRWQISRAVAWQYLPPLAVMAALAILWSLRHRTRAPLAGALFFLGTLFPVAGFLNLYVFRYSLVTDHFQYLPSLGIIALFSAGVALLIKRAEGWGSVWGKTGCVALLAVLAVLTWRQTRMYANIDTLYKTTIARNPGCWMAYNNLGNTLIRRGKLDEAVKKLRKGLEIKADNPELHFNLGTVLARCGQVDEAIAHYRRALEIQPDYAKAHTELGLALASRGQVDEAIAHYRMALEINPRHAEAHNDLGIALASRGQIDEAIDHFRKALEIKADNPEAHNDLGIALYGRGQVEEALEHYQKALELATARDDRALADAIRARIMSARRAGRSPSPGKSVAP